MKEFPEKTPDFKTGSVCRATQRLLRFAILVSLLIFCATACKRKAEQAKLEQVFAQNLPKLPENEPPHTKIPIHREIAVGGFFKFIDEVVGQNDTLAAYKLTENLLLRANPWILDTLVSTDYYTQASRGNIVYDQRKMVVLKPGDTLLIPGPKTAASLLEKMANTRLNINIPAFEMRIMEYDSVLFTVQVRVGKNQKKYLEMAGGKVDLRTRTGMGEIIRVNRSPAFFDPVTGKKFKFTKRDDHQTTFMPQIPWLEPAINGQRYGQMIHPTTNPKTLGKAASNGCIGTNEADGWRVYFFAPIGTKVLIRYDLQAINEQGDTLRYDDVYHLRRSDKEVRPIAVAGFLPKKTAAICVCDSMFFAL